MVALRFDLRQSELSPAYTSFCLFEQEHQGDCRDVRACNVDARKGFVGLHHKGLRVEDAD
jgi:hypothetical protein